MQRLPPLPASLVTRFALLCLGVWLHAADTLVTATIAPAIVADLHGIAYINWTITLYQVGAIISGSATGALCNRFDIKRVFITATLAYLAGCVLGALAPTMAVLVASRLLQGLGGGILLSLCYVAIERWYAPAAWGRLFGVVAVVWAGGSLLGPLIGGLFAGSHIWRGAFWIFALQAVLLGVLVSAIFPAATRPNTDPEPAPPRWPVLPLVILSAATLVIAQAGVTSRVGLSIAGCLLGTGLLYLAARVDARAAVRLLPNQLLHLRHPVGAGLMMVFALGVGTTGFWAYGPLLTNILFGTSPLVTAYILAGEALAWSVGTMAVSRATAAAEIPLIRVGALAVALGSAGFAIAVPAGSLVGMVVCSLLQGAGFGVCWPAVVQRIVHYAAPAERSLASGSISTVQRIGYAVGTASVGIAANISGLVEGASASAARQAGFWVFAAFVPVLAAGLWCAWKFTNSCQTTVTDVRSLHL